MTTKKKTATKPQAEALEPVTLETITEAQKRDIEALVRAWNPLDGYFKRPLEEWGTIFQDDGLRILNAHRALVARDTAELRERLEAVDVPTEAKPAPASGDVCAVCLRRERGSQCKREPASEPGKDAR